MRAAIRDIRRLKDWDHDEDDLTVEVRKEFLATMRSAGGIFCALHAMRTYHNHEAISQHALTLLGVLGAAKLSTRPSEAQLKEEAMIVSLPISDGAFYNLAPPLRLNKSDRPCCGSFPTGIAGVSLLQQGWSDDDDPEFDSVAAAGAAIDAMDMQKNALPPELAYLSAPSGYEAEILGSGAVPLALNALNRNDAPPGLRSAGLAMLSTLAHEHTEQKMATERKHAAAVDVAGEREAENARRGTLLAHELQQQLDRGGVKSEEALLQRASRCSTDDDEVDGDECTVGTKGSATLLCVVATGLHDGGCD
jgi:hypothetical protein